MYSISVIAIKNQRSQVKNTAHHRNLNRQVNDRLKGRSWRYCTRSNCLDTLSINAVFPQVPYPSPQLLRYFRFFHSHSWGKPVGYHGTVPITASMQNSRPNPWPTLIKAKGNHAPQESTGGAHLPLPGLEPVGGEPLLSVTRGQCDARPTVTFPAARHHRPLAGTKLYCLVT